MSAMFGNQPIAPDRIALLRNLTDRQRVFPPRPQPVLQQVEEVFDAFATDYSQARSVFFDSVINGDESSLDGGRLNSFENYTVQRVTLLSEELIGAIQNPLLNRSGQKGGGHGAFGGRPFIVRRISAFPSQDMDLEQLQPNRRTLLVNLLLPLRDNTLSVGENFANQTEQITSISREAVPFIMLAQDNAIESARASVVNGAAVYRSLFSNRK
ncbi:hypothetical protein AB1L88_02030 [Tautonia sp. JC769]|uniref:hypothetical protein n=1 Tax=Tautonia sp. JC769 TaxID=3232135 RepID=UPI00345917D4